MTSTILATIKQSNSTNTPITSTILPIKNASFTDSDHTTTNLPPIITNGSITVPIQPHPNIPTNSIYSTVDNIGNMPSNTISTIPANYITNTTNNIIDNVGSNTVQSINNSNHNSDNTSISTIIHPVPVPVTQVHQRLHSGLSCHQCKNIKQLHQLAYCSHLFNKRVKHELRVCQKKFCANCLIKFYHEQLADAQTAEWVCPSCRNVCICAACQRKIKLRPHKTNNHKRMDHDNNNDTNISQPATQKMKLEHHNNNIMNNQSINSAINTIPMHTIKTIPAIIPNTTVMANAVPTQSLPAYINTNRPIVQINNPNHRFNRSFTAPNTQQYTSPVPHVYIPPTQPYLSTSSPIIDSHYHQNTNNNTHNSIQYHTDVYQYPSSSSHTHYNTQPHSIPHSPQPSLQHTSHSPTVLITPHNPSYHASQPQHSIDQRAVSTGNTINTNTTNHKLSEPLSGNRLLNISTNNLLLAPSPFVSRRTSSFNSVTSGLTSPNLLSKQVSQQSIDAHAALQSLKYQQQYKEQNNS